MKTDTIGNRLFKRLLPASWHHAPPADVDRNTNTLARLEENDPTLVCVRDHAFAQFADALAVTLDQEQPAARRISAADSASGLKRFLEDLEFRRQGWNEQRILDLREAEARAKAGKV